MSKKQTEQDKQMIEQLKQKLPQIPEKYQKLCNLQYVRDEHARKEIIWVIDELSKINGLVLEKTGDHDLSVRYKGRQLVKVCPLSKAWSASIQGSKIQRYTKEHLIEYVKKQIEGTASNTSTDGNLIQKLEDRINNLSEKSKGISLKGIERTKEFEEWVKKKGYTVYDELLLVK